MKNSRSTFRSITMPPIPFAMRRPYQAIPRQRLTGSCHRLVGTRQESRYGSGGGPVQLSCGGKVGRAKAAHAHEPKACSLGSFATFERTVVPDAQRLTTGRAAARIARTSK